MKDLVEVVKSLELDENDEPVYKESFMISRDNLENVVLDYMDGFDDVDEFLENYYPELDGEEVYEIAKDKGWIESEELINLLDGDNDGEEIDITGFESIDDYSDDSDLEDEESSDDEIDSYFVKSDLDEFRDDEDLFS